LKLEALRREKAALSEENERLCGEVAEVMARRPREPEKERLDPREAERRYAEALSAILDAKRKAAAQKDRGDRQAFELQARLDEKEFKAKKIHDSFRAFKREIFLGAEHSRTGKKLPKAVIDEFEAQERERDAELEKVRLKNINMRHALRKCESKLRAKEQLAEGLHLIDFEQLKIENAALAEKIEERKEDIAKLARSTRAPCGSRRTAARRWPLKKSSATAGGRPWSRWTRSWLRSGMPWRSSRSGGRRCGCASSPRPRTPGSWGTTRWY